MILEFLARFLRKRHKREMNERDLARINASADRLNTEAEEVVKYQVDDQSPRVDS